MTVYIPYILFSCACFIGYENVTKILIRIPIIFRHYLVFVDL